jgi:hypothetical protein
MAEVKTGHFCIEGHYKDIKGVTLMEKRAYPALKRTHVSGLIKYSTRK